MSILKTSDFQVRPYRIKHVEENNDFPEFISNMEAQILRDVLGNALYEEFITAISTSSPDQKWVDLKNGKNYEGDNEVLYRYAGVKSFLIPAIYALWLSATFDRHNDGGINVPDDEKYQLLSPAVRMSQAIAESLSKVGDEHNHKNTLYGFLYQSDDEYDDWVFKVPECIDGINRFGI